jgi:hypothetical protein
VQSAQLGTHINFVQHAVSVCCCKTLITSVVSPFTTLMRGAPEVHLQRRRESNRYETAMCCMWGVGGGSCVQACSVSVPVLGWQGFLSVSVRSVVERGPASVSRGASTRLSSSLKQPAAVSVRPVPANQQSVAIPWQTPNCARQQLKAVEVLVRNRTKRHAVASKAGGRWPRRNGALETSDSRLTPRYSAFLRSVSSAQRRRQGGELQHVHTPARKSLVQ